MWGARENRWIKMEDKLMCEKDILSLKLMLQLK